MITKTNGKTKLSLNKRTIVLLNEQNMSRIDGAEGGGESGGCPSRAACDLTTNKNYTCTCAPPKTKNTTNATTLQRNTLEEQYCL